MSVQKYDEISNTVFLKTFSNTFKYIKMFASWIEKNQDNIVEYLLGLSNLNDWYKAIEKLSKSQYMFTDDLDLDFAQKVNESDDVDLLIEKYYFNNDGNNIKKVIDHCNSKNILSAQSNLYIEIIEAYKLGHYHLAIVGLFALIDGVLSEISETEITNFKKRIEIVRKKIYKRNPLKSLDRKLLCISLSMGFFEKSVFSNSDFLKTEPAFVNRHWLLHGRTNRVYNKIDFLKALLWLDAFLIVKDISLNEK